MFKVILEAEICESYHNIIGYFAIDYLSAEKEIRDLVDLGFKRWILQKGFSEKRVMMFPSAVLVNMAFNLVNGGYYDLGIGIAKGGLVLSYLCYLFGLDVRICKVHAHDRPLSKATFKWIDKIHPEEIAGRRIIVLM